MRLGGALFAFTLFMLVVVFMAAASFDKQLISINAEQAKVNRELLLAIKELRTACKGNHP